MCTAYDASLRVSQGWMAFTIPYGACAHGQTMPSLDRRSGVWRENLRQDGRLLALRGLDQEGLLFQDRRVAIHEMRQRAEVVLVEECDGDLRRPLYAECLHDAPPA